jgi:hypothetical protein
LIALCGWGSRFGGVSFVMGWKAASIAAQFPDRRFS